MNDSDTPVAILMASCVHDAKNALCTLQQRLDALDDSLGDVEASRHITADLRYGLSRIHHDLLALLTTYKIEQRSYSLHLELHHVSELVDDLLAQQRSALAIRGLQLQLQLQPQLTAYLDYNLVMGALGNALNNAVRHARSTLLIRGELRADGFTVIAVQDDGPGFPDALLKHNWNDQTSATAGTAGEAAFASGNTGLGLHFAAVSARAHRAGNRRGRIELSNPAPLGGACLSLVLP